MGRPTIVETLMKTAFVWSERGTCSRRYVGAVIADDRGHIISEGYNGALSGFPHCAPHTDHNPCDSSEHAERNAIYAAARKGIALGTMHMYATDSPCFGCARGIIQVGIVSLTYGRAYRDESGVALLIRAGLRVERFTKFNEWVYG